MKNVCNGWDLRDYTYINLCPDDSVSEENRAWQGCPSVAVTQKGRVFAAWYTGGAFEPCIYNYGLLSVSDDRGENWSKPILSVGTDMAKRLRNIDLEVWVNADNSLWVMWTVTPYGETSVPATIKTPFPLDYQCDFPYTGVMVCKNPDDDVLVWEEPHTMCEGFMRNKPIVTSSGRILAPAYQFDELRYTLRCSDDGGESFRVVAAEGKPELEVFDEITVCERLPGQLRFLARTNQGVYLYSDSSDDGETWTVAKEYEPAPSTRCYLGKLRNGMVAYVRNISDTLRCGMKICLSEDGGETFPYEMVLDTRERVSYPELDEDEKGNLYIIYDRERDNRVKLNTETWISEAAKEILLCRITTDDVKNKTLSDSSFIGKVISKAKINLVEH